ncbi:MAG: type II secretion system protein, partial [Patescibacteria group bacterium]|nr:type II secretion system protein [Patescibacteria group bacterium]
KLQAVFQAEILFPPQVKNMFKKIIAKIVSVLKKTKNTKADSYGFTLIELLAVIIVFSLISGIGTVILVTSLRTSTKTDTLINVKQNGNYVITQMSKTVENAQSVSSPLVVSPTPTCITTTNLTPVPTINAITLTDPDGNQTTFTCDTTNKSISYYTSANPTPQPYLDPNSVMTTSCGFTCSQSSITDYPVVGISFSLISAKPTGVVENTASSNPIIFSTNITLRNKNR